MPPENDPWNDLLRLGEAIGNSWPPSIIAGTGGRPVSGPWRPNAPRGSVMMREAATGRPVGSAPARVIPLWEWLYRGGGQGDINRVDLLHIRDLWDRNRSRIWADSGAAAGIFTEDPPRRDAPNPLPQVTEAAALGHWIDAYQQVSWWQAVRTSGPPEMDSHARKQAKAWANLRDTAGETALPQLRRAVAVLEQAAGAPAAPTPLVGAGTWH